MMPEKPLTMRLGESSQVGFNPGLGTSIPPLPTTPASAPGPRSLVDQMAAPPVAPVEIGDALAAITTQLSRTVSQSSDDDVAKRLLLEWADYSEKLSSFFRERKETRTAFLRSEDRRLTLAAREVQGHISEMRRKQNSLMAAWNNAEETASNLRAALNAVLAASPGDLMDDDSYVLPEETAAWQERVNDARAKVETQHRAMAPVTNQIQEIDQQIAVESEKLEKIHHERLQTRDELQGFDRRGPIDTGLRGRTGRARLTF